MGRKLGARRISAAGASCLAFSAKRGPAFLLARKVKRDAWPHRQTGPAPHSHLRLTLRSSHTPLCTVWEGMVDGWATEPQPLSNPGQQTAT